MRSAVVSLLTAGAIALTGTPASAQWTGSRDETMFLSEFIRVMQTGNPTIAAEFAQNSTLAPSVIETGDLICGRLRMGDPLTDIQARLYDAANARPLVERINLIGYFSSVLVLSPLYLCPEVPLP